MESWFDMEKRFRVLAPDLQHHRLDAQWGAAGEYWRVAGFGRSPATEQFEMLSSLAGQLLGGVLGGGNELEQALLSIKDSKIRWYQALKALSSAFKSDGYGEQLNEDGSSGGFIYTGTINQIAEVSANLCLSLQISHPIAKTHQEKNVTQINNFHGAITGQVNIAGKAIAAPALNLTLGDILAKIDASSAPEEEKKNAMSALGQFLAHPLVGSVVGALVTNLGS